MITNGLRDLVDFFPLYLDLKRTLDKLPPSQGYVYKLKHADSSITFVEGVTDQITLTRTNSYEFLETFATSVAFSEKEVKVANPMGQELSADFLAKILAFDENGIVLVEAQAATTSPLLLEISKNGQVVNTSTFPLEIVTVQKMFGHKNIRSVAGGTGGAQNLDLASADARTPFCQDVDKTLVWIHGYNNDGDAATATFAEVYKRLFQAGYNGKFYGVSWFGDPPAPAAPHYHQAVVNAFATAETYAQFVDTLASRGKVSVVGHSLGNMVVGAAIQDHALNSFAKYFAVDAAVALEAYGDKAEDESMIKVDDWLDYWNYTPDSGGTYPARKLLASEWSVRFPQTDNRHKLTWRDRLNKVPSAKIYNFYSSTEDVLQKYDNDALVGTQIWWNLDRIIDYLATATWVKQEKFKGRRKIWNVADNLGGCSGRYGGWSFNDAWYTILKGDGGDPDIKIKTKPSKVDYADLISSNYDQLKTKPFFDLCTTSGSDCFGIEVLASADQEGSDFVNDTIEDSDHLGDYYTDNSTAHSKVTVRDWLLAEAFPATTLPMGANENNRILDKQEIDMSKRAKDDGCKTSEDDWPRDDTYIPNEKDWKHSDYKDVPYQHVYEFYKKINELFN